MNLSTYIAAYLGVGFLLLAWGAAVDAQSSVRAVFWCCLFWPLILFVAVPLVLLEDVLQRRGWNVNIEIRRDLSFHGFRRPTEDRGWAVRFAWVELQVWKRAAP